MKNESPESKVINPALIEGGTWHPYLNDQEDVIGCVALALHLSSIFEKESEVSLRELISDGSIFTDAARFSHRMAAEKLTDTYFTNNSRIKDQLNKSDDPLYLLIKAAISEHTGQVDRQVSRIINNSSLPKQIIVAAASGLIVSLFIVMSMALQWSLQDILHLFNR